MVGTTRSATVAAAAIGDSQRLLSFHAIAVNAIPTMAEAATAGTSKRSERRLDSSRFAQGPYVKSIWGPNCLPAKIAALMPFDQLLSRSTRGAWTGKTDASQAANRRSPKVIGWDVSCTRARLKEMITVAKMASALS